jgi:hypothetical protein
MIEAFPHGSGEHCGSTSLHDVATFGDWGVSEPLCFGIGGGLGFSYFERDGSPSREFVGRTPWLESAFFEHLGVDVDETLREDATASFDALRSHVEAGRPVVAFVDIYHLPYFGSDVHFAPHVVVVVDVDDDAVTVADSEFDALQRVDRDAFDAAWRSDHGFYGPLDRRLLVARSEPTTDRDDAMRAGLAAVADGLLEPDSQYAEIADTGDATNGIAGMRAMANELPEWHALEDADWVTRFAYQNVEKRGTGGAAFRGLFRPFLETASDRLDAVTAGDVAEFEGIESDWHAFGDALKRAGLADDADTARDAYRDASATLRGIADREAALFATIRERL